VVDILMCLYRTVITAYTMWFSNERTQYFANTVYVWDLYYFHNILHPIIDSYFDGVSHSSMVLLCEQTAFLRVSVVFMIISFWNTRIMPYGLVDRYKGFGQTCSLHLQSSYLNKDTAGSSTIFDTQKLNCTLYLWNHNWHSPM
jgi:hypothetical protein